MAPALLVLIALFALLFLVRLSAARRAALIQRWPAVLLASAAFLALARGGLWAGFGFALAAAIAWHMWPRLSAPRSAPGAPDANDPAEAEARAILGVGSDATVAQIRAAYRAKMARAHPDRGGSHAEAARLTAARDRLLRNRR